MFQSTVLELEPENIRVVHVPIKAIGTQIRKKTRSFGWIV